MTTTEHAELIERLSRRLHHLEGTYSEGEIELLSDKSTALIMDIESALRTSHRDGWLGAAAWLEENPDKGHLLIEYGYIPTESDRLRRNAPQEDTDEA